MNLDYLKNLLKKKLSLPRYEHSIRVLDTALELSNSLSSHDKEKIAIASLLHDYAKELPKQRLIELYQSKEEKTLNLPILHSFVGADLVEKELNITDVEILNAIKYHTTGKAKMSLIEKIVYLADAIEPKRSYHAVDKIRELAKINIDKALLLEVKEKIKYLKSEGLQIDNNSIEMLKWLTEKEGK